jgi:hypothetical protein
VDSEEKRIFLKKEENKKPTQTGCGSIHCNPRIQEAEAGGSPIPVFKLRSGKVPLSGGWDVWALREANENMTAKQDGIQEGTGKAAV